MTQDQLLLSAFKKVLANEESYVDVDFFGEETARLTLDHGTLLTKEEGEAVDSFAEAAELALKLTYGR